LIARRQLARHRQARVLLAPCAKDQLILRIVELEIAFQALFQMAGEPCSGFRMLTGGVKSSACRLLRRRASRYFQVATKAIMVKIVEVRIPAVD
jgi:hypothetical protein